MPSVKKAPISLATVDVLVKEVMTEGAHEYGTVLEKLLKAKPATERHRELLCGLWAAAAVIETKAKTAQEVIDEYLDSLPDDDEDD
ncbi:MAG: hypothetical protein ACRD2B_06070 [Terriglobia bacterium]